VHDFKKVCATDILDGIHHTNFKYVYRSVSIAFGFVGEFILRRSNEVGSENWGKAISCDPPQYFPGYFFGIKILLEPIFAILKKGLA